MQPIQLKCGCGAGFQSVKKYGEEATEHLNACQIPSKKWSAADGKTFETSS